MADDDDVEGARLSRETVAERRVRLGADAPREQPDHRGRNLAAVIATGVLALVVLVVIIGFPGPEPVRRWPASSLIATADRINADATADYESPRPKYTGGHEREPASIDWLRGRIRIDGPLPCMVRWEHPGDWEMLLPHASESCGEL